MFNIPPAKANEFEKLYKTHRVQISACDVFFQNIRMLNGRHRIMDRNTFVENYKNFTADIELQSAPIDAFIPSEGPSAPTDTPDEIDPAELIKENRLFLVNRSVPEYERMQKRITLDELKSTLNETHPVIMALVNNEVTLEDVIDDIFIYWALFKYIEQIETIRIQIFANMTPMMEWIADHVTLDVMKKHLRKDKINYEKIDKYLEDMMYFAPDHKMICDFYESTEESPWHFDLDNLINRILTNLDASGDRYIALGIYLIASYAVADIKGHAMDSKDVKYVEEVISKA